MAEWVKVADVNELAPGEKKTIDLEGLEVALFNVDGEYYAIEDICTHDGAPLAHGDFVGEEIICPRHGARFCLNTGAALTPPAYESLAVFPTRVEHGRIQIDIDP